MTLALWLKPIIVSVLEPNSRPSYPLLGPARWKKAGNVVGKKFSRIKGKDPLQVS